MPIKVGDFERAFADSKPADSDERGHETSVTKNRIQRDFCHACSVTVGHLIVAPKPKPNTQRKGVVRMHSESVGDL